MKYNEVTEVKQARNSGRANELLSEGWVLIHITSDAVDGNVVYVFGKNE